MRSLQEIFVKKKGTPMSPAYFIQAPNGQAFPMQIEEGLCLCVFGTKKGAQEFIDAMLPEPYRSQCRVGTWFTYEQVEAWMKREGGRFDVVSAGPAADPAATVHYLPIDNLLRFAREEVRV